MSTEIRSEFERDVDRIFYNYYFRRLGEITQVSSGFDRILRHNRMTHSLKVAQVGRRLVQYLQNDGHNRPGIDAVGGIDADVVGAAGLLHDAGHPPFGHVGEEQLNIIARRHNLRDGYEGNAQVLRILLSLTSHMSEDGEPKNGLDLTWAVVAACVKYPYPRDEAKPTSPNKWGYYSTESKLFEEYISPLLPAPATPTLEAEIMDWADDITYAVHDLQDYYTDGIIPLHYLRHYQNGDTDYRSVHQREVNDFWQYVTARLERIAGPETYVARHEFERYAAEFPQGPFRGRRDETAKLGALASRIITDASKATRVTDEGRLYIDPKMRSVISGLKLVTWYYVIDHPDLVSTQIGQRAQIENVFGKLNKWVDFAFRQREGGVDLTTDEQWIRKRRLPPVLNEFIEQLLAANFGRGAYASRKECFLRGVIDYIASLTEVEFVRLHRRLSPVENHEMDRDDLHGPAGL